MPSASTAKLEKQASSEAPDVIKQGIVFVEHKIRNLMKKKGRLDGYKELQKSGKELDSDQKSALLKYDELCQNLVFAQEFSKHLNTIAQDAIKWQKKKEKKEAYEREQVEAAKVKEILVIQDVLASMGNDSVREDFLAGRNKACTLTETELQHLDDLFGEVSPKRDPEEGQPPFNEQTQSAAKHLLSIVEGKDKEIVGTKYSTLKEIIDKINGCGYFDHSTTQEQTTQEGAEEEVAHEEQQAVESVEPEAEELEPETVTYQQNTAPNVEPVVAPVVETAGLYISQRPMTDEITNVMGAGPTAFNFIQESELEAPEAAVVPATTPLPIPTQTFTNANFTPSQAAAAPVYAQQPEVMYNPPVNAPAQYSPVPPAQPTVSTLQFEPSSNFQNTSEGGTGDWTETTEQSNDWAMQVEQNDQNRWSEPTPPSDEWGDNSNDGFQPATRGSNRGRGRGGGSDRGRGGRGGGRGNYQNGRGNYNNNQNGRGGGGYYKNSEGGGSGNNYYQNGYQSRGDGERGYRGDNREGGQRRGGPRGGGQDRGGPRSDRGAPRGGGGRGGGNPRGGNRGSRQ